MEMYLRLSVRRDFHIEAPQFRVPPSALAGAEGTGYHVSTGVAPDLMEATRQAVRTILTALLEHYANDPPSEGDPDPKVAAVDYEAGMTDPAGPNQMAPPLTVHTEAVFAVAF